MRPFYLFKRSNGFYYVQFSDRTLHRQSVAKSTGVKQFAQAMEIACDWFKNGFPASGSARNAVAAETAVQNLVHLISHDMLLPSQYDKILQSLSAKGFGIRAVPKAVRTKETLSEYLMRFWDFDTSPYVREKIAHGQRIGKLHCKTTQNRVKYWQEYFGDKSLDDVTTQDLRQFELSLVDLKLSGSTMNYIMQTGKSAFKWAYQNKLIAVDPALGLMRYSVMDKKERGILDIEEAQKLFSLVWEHERAKVANLVAMTCGLRKGEILALRNCDIGEDRLYVRHSWSRVDGLKVPKNTHEREVPLLDFVRVALKKISMQNPFGWNDENFVFWSSLPDQPLSEDVISEEFEKALDRIGILSENRKTRNIVFHSWRHFYAKMMVDRVDQRQAQLALGHLTAAMTQHYADHKTEADLAAVASAARNAFAVGFTAV